MLPGQDVAQNILSAIETSLDAAFELYEALEKEDMAVFSQIGADLLELLLVLKDNGYEQAKENKTIKLGAAAESTIYSLEKILEYAMGDTARALHKLEFELIPFIKAMYAQYYFWTSIFPDESKHEAFFRDERPLLYENPYIEQSMRDGKYKYDLTIAVTGYNKLSYTKGCVESLLNNLPKDVTYELILSNHGSADGTKEYFESVKPDKQIDTKINGSVYGVGFMVIEGEFFLNISNDTLITPGAIDNMLRAMREDPGIGWVVPTTPNVTNYQTIPADYEDAEGLMKWAEGNNVYDPFRHEVRTRLCNPITLYRSSTFLSKAGIGYAGYQYTAGGEGIMAFPDDHISMLFRRRGLKSVLAKDAYCHHYGSVTINDDIKKKRINKDQAYARGIADFKRAFGIDPWGTGFCYDAELFEDFECRLDGHIEVLGINCGLGSNSLKIKELYKENKRNLDVTLTNVTQDESVLLDLQGVSDNAAVIRRLADAFEGERDKKYHYIVLEDKLKGLAYGSAAESLLARLWSGGELYIKCDAKVFKGKLGQVTQIGEWTRVRTVNSEQ